MVGGMGNFFCPGINERWTESLRMLIKLRSVLVGSVAWGGGYGKGAGLVSKKFKSEFSPNKNASGWGVSNFSPPIIKWFEKYDPPFFGGYL